MTLSQGKGSPKGIALAPFIVSPILGLCSGALHAQAGPCGGVSGLFSTGIVCNPGAGKAATITTSDGTAFTTSGVASVRAVGNNASASVVLNGTTVSSTNVPATSHAVQAQVSGTVANASSVAIGGAPTSILVQGTGLDAVSVTNTTAGPSSILVALGSQLNITHNVAGNEHDGFDINASGGGDATVNHAGTGRIEVLGGNGVWVKGTGAGNVSVQVGAGTTIAIDNTNPLSAASNHAGLQARSTGSGSITIENSATLQSTGKRGFGIYSQAATGSTSVRNSGAISTTGDEGSGIRASATNAAIEVRNSGMITTTGATAHGIYVNPGTASTGNIVVVNDGAIAVGSAGENAGSRGIYLIGRGNGSVQITGSGNVTVDGNPATTRGQGIIANSDAGNIAVDYAGAFSVRGEGAGGIRVDARAGNVDVNYTGSGIETFNSSANAIYATAASDTNTVSVRAQGTLVTHSNLGGQGDGTGIGSFGVQALSQGGDVSVAFSGPRIDVNGRGAALLAGNAYEGGTGLGTLSVDNSGSLTVRGDKQQGIHTRSTTGAQTIGNRGAIQTLGATSSQGILAEATSAAAISVVNDGAISTRGNNASGIDVRSGAGSADVRNSQAISAGWGSSAGVAMGGVSQSLTNSGAIQALSDVAVQADTSGLGGADEVVRPPIDIDPPAVPDPVEPEPAALEKPRGPLRLNAPAAPGVVLVNTGQLDGTVQAGTSPVSLGNSGTWNLRSFADTDGDGVRDTWRVAQSNLGTAGANTIVNTGTLNLVAQPASGIVTFDGAGAYLPLGRVSNVPALGGAVQGQILGVSSFTHSGLIDLTGGGTAVGNTLVISGGQVAGQNGGGVFVSNGGRLKINTVLDDGGADSRSDMLVVDSTRTGAGGPTRLQVRNVGGAGDLTVANGIAVVELTNRAATASDPNAFTLDSRAVAGPYEYRLMRGAADGTGVDAWYLRSEQEPTPPAPPAPPAPPSPPSPPAPPTPADLPIPRKPLFRPEVGAYLANQRQAGGMFLHSLHDRLGEPQWIESQQFDKPEDKRRSGWLRLVGRRTDSTSSDGTFDLDTDSLLIQGGGDIARWSVLKDANATPPDRLHLGLMLGYGKADTDASAIGNPARAKGTAEGWSVGGYGTWYQNDENKLGWYTDLWGTYGWFNNSVRGDTLPQVKYDANALTLSAETGYAMRVREGSDWIVEPQAQVVYVKYSEDDITEPNGTRIHGGEGSGWIGRLGLRTHRTWVGESGRRTQPYFTLNWWHDRTDNTLAFNAVQLQDMYPRNRYEVKLGVSADLDKGWTGWANVGYLWGSQGYQSISGRIGAKYSW